jgi:Zn-dependent protease
MRWSLRLGSVSGIGIYIHWTFLILIGYVIWMNAGAGTTPTLMAVALTLSVFICVVLHELGHALMAQRFGIRTRDITLLPIGGVARLERIPDNPTQELLVAIAGPLVNVIIAGALLLGLVIGGRLPSVPDELRRLAENPGAAPSGLGFLLKLFTINVMLVLFNLLPAFPMDGGRVVRALLAHWMDYARATRIAAVIGQVMAMLFVAWGLFGGGPFMVIIGIFVFLGAQSEAQLAEVRADLSGVPVRDAMLTHFEVLPATGNLATASGILLAGSQQDFPVMDGERIAGVLTRADLFRAMASSGPDTPITSVMRRDCRPVEENDRLFRVFQRMQETGCPIVPVTRRGQLVGLVTLENVGELMAIKSALRHTPGTPAHPAFP